MRCVRCGSERAERWICDDCIRKYALPLSDGQRAAVREAMSRLPAEDHFYLFWTGRVEGQAELRGRLTSRAAQLNSVAQDGFPRLVSRRMMGILYPNG